MNDLLKITEDLTKRIIDMPDGPVEILRVRRALSQSMRWCVKGSRIATGVLH